MRNWARRMCARIYCNRMQQNGMFQDGNLSFWIAQGWKAQMLAVWNIIIDPNTPPTNHHESNLESGFAPCRNSQTKRATKGLTHFGRQESARSCKLRFDVIWRFLPELRYPVLILYFDTIYFPLFFKYRKLFILGYQQKPPIWDYFMV